MQRFQMAKGLAGACVVAVVAAVAGGCQPPPPPPPPPAPPLKPPVVTMAPDTYQSMKAAYLKANPTARVGRVVEVLPDAKRLAAGDIPTKDFMKGDVVSVIDGDMRLIANGTVVNVDNDLLYVQYEPATVGTNRDPVKGDLVIRAEQPDRSQYR